MAAEVAAALDAPLDVCLVRKLGVPYQPELAMGAIGEDGVRVLNADVLRGTGVREDELARIEERERRVLAERAERYRGECPSVPLTGRTAVVVDDGVATGSTARVACRVARARGAARIVLAVPVAPATSPAASAATPTTSSAWRHPGTSPPSDSSTTTSPRPRTRRSRHVCAGHGDVVRAPDRAAGPPSGR